MGFTERAQERLIRVIVESDYQLVESEISEDINLILICNSREMKVENIIFHRRFNLGFVRLHW